MEYINTCKAAFVQRPNRFIAMACLSDSKVPVICHVKNTGRCRELLLPGSQLVLEHHPDAVKKGRKTEYSLICVYKKHAGCSGRTLLINMDSQAPNEAAYEWLAGGGFGSICGLQREVRFGSSRFDLSFQKDGKIYFMEVKGVTLEHNGTASFPDAPTERGLKHLLELQEAVREGYGAAVLFVIQMKDICSFTPNRTTHPAFADALKEASRNGVQILAQDCIVTERSMTIDQSVPVIL